MAVSRYCAGFLSTELKVAQVGVNGRAFASAWENSKKWCVDAVSKVLKCKGSRYGAVMLILVGVCDAVKLLSKDLPFFVKV